MALKKNDLVEMEITGTSHEGEGIGRAENLVVFTPHAAEGDRIRAKILCVKKSFAYAKLMEVLSPSAARIVPDCGVFGTCGGCVFRHIAYGEELRVKYRRVCDALRKIGRLAVEPEAILGSEMVQGYRNKAQYPVGMRGGELIAGFYAPNSHRMVDAKSCLLQPECFERALEGFSQWVKACRVSVYNEETGEGLLRHIYLRQAHATGELMACAVINGDDIPGRDILVALLRKYAPETASIVLNSNKKPGNAVLGEKCRVVWGAGSITDVFCGLKIGISPLSFYQVNSGQAEKLYALAADFAELRGNETLLDLYCGTGTIGLSMAGKVKKVVGVEIVGDAVEDARRNAQRNGISNAEFFCGDAGRAAAGFLKQGKRPDVVVVDPPRKGLSPLTVDAVVKMEPARVVYLSCDPATLARDILKFTESGYVCARVKPVDMFPRTAHVETVALLKRKQSRTV